MSTRITVLCWALPLQLLHFETVHEWPWIHEEHLQHCKEIDVAHKVDQEHHHCDLPPAEDVHQEGNDREELSIAKE